MLMCKISDLCDVVKGVTSIQKASPGIYPLVVTAEDRLSSDEYQFDCKAVCIPLVSSTGHGHASIKRIHYQEGKFALGSILAAVISKDENVLDTKYLYTYLSFFKDSILVPLMKGSANVSLTVKSLMSAEIIVPSIYKQRSIINTVESLKVKFDKIYLKLYEQDKNINELRQAILQQAVEGKLVPQYPNDEPANVLLAKIAEEKERLIKEGKIKKEKLFPPISEDEIPYELPNGWEWAYINEIAFVTKLAGFEYTKYLSTAISNSGEVPIVRAQNIKMNRFIDSSAEFISFELSEKLNRSALYKKCVLMTFIGAGIGEVSIFNRNKRYHLAPNVAKVEIFNNFSLNIDEKYLLYYLMSATGQREIFGFLKATAQPSLSMETIRKIRVPIPPLQEQMRIIEKVDQLMSLCDKLEKNIEQSKNDSELLMQSVLQKAFKKE